MELRRGTYLKRGEYTILSKLGRGGFGITYLAIQARSNMQVCVKEFFPEEFYYRRINSNDLILSRPDAANRMERFKRKFINEARIISRMRHPNIVHIYDTFEENNTVYYVMEYIDGMSLADAITRYGAMSEDHSRYYISQVAGALHHVHQNHILHLDVKPGNIMLRRSDNRAILIDFGISKGYDDDGNPLSSTYSAVSHGFAPYEQYTSGAMGVFSPQTDIYALGATLYNMLTGKVPPQALELIDSELPALPSNFSNSIRRAVAAAMRFRREERPHSIEEFLKILQSSMVEDNPPRTPRTPRTPRPPKPPRPPQGLQDSGPISEEIDGTKQRKSWIIWLGVAVTLVWIVMIALVAVSIGRDDSNSTYQSIMTNEPIAIHGEVDLGLSVNWATCNVGADNEWESGNFYAWGQTFSKDEYMKDYTKPEGDISGNSKYDAATANWGDGWRMPTKEELEDLVNKCTWERTNRKGMNGYVVSRNGKSIFLPICGGANGKNITKTIPESRKNGRAGYWSGTNHSVDTSAYILWFTTKDDKPIYAVTTTPFHMGRSIRPVRDKR